MYKNKICLILNLHPFVNMIFLKFYLLIFHFERDPHLCMAHLSLIYFLEKENNFNILAIVNIHYHTSLYFLFTHITID